MRRGIKRYVISGAIVGLLTGGLSNDGGWQVAAQESSRRTLLPPASDAIYTVTVARGAELVVSLDGEGDADLDVIILGVGGTVLGQDIAVSNDATVRIPQSTESRTLTLRLRNLGSASNNALLTVRGGALVPGNPTIEPAGPSGPVGPAAPGVPIGGQFPTSAGPPPKPPSPTISAPPGEVSLSVQVPGLAVVPVFYATDRIHSAGTPLTYGMTRNPSGALFLGRFDVSIPRDDRHRLGQIERPDIWTLWREDPTKHFVIVSRRQQSYEEFYGDISALVNRSSAKEAFVFVHGFNVSFEGAIFRTAQIAYDLGFDGAPILYSWPSAESVTPIGYATDAANNDWTVRHLRWFLEDVAARTGAMRVHLIAHSMGNKALVNALNQMPRSSTRKFAQIVLTAPDIDADTFVQLADAVRLNSQMTTLYASSNDAALIASRRLQTYRRAGDVSGGVVIVPGIDTVDVSAVNTDLVGHAYYGDNTSVISDIFLVVTQGLPPPKRPRLRPTGAPPRQYWRFVP